MDVKEFEAKLKEATDRIALTEQENARMREALTLRDAREFVGTELQTATLPDVTKARLLGLLASNPPVKDGSLDKATYAARIAEAVKAETEYLAQVSGYGNGRITGMGGSQASTSAQEDEATAKRMSAAFAGLGLSGAGVRHAVNGRGF